MGRAEGKVESYLDQRVREYGGETRKVVYAGRRGSPDRWCFFKGGRLCMVECKTRSRSSRVSAAQMDAIKFLVDFGFTVYTVYDKADVDAVLLNFFGYYPGENVDDLV